MFKNLDTKQSLSFHQQLIKKKKILSNVYLEFYTTIKSLIKPQGKVVELGSGAGFIKNFIPHTITSDVIAGRDIDKVFSATKIPFKNSSISNFVMIDVLHHIKNPEKALKEMARCLVKRGKIIMIEPYNSIWGRFIYQNFHHEDFNPGSGWNIKGKGRLSDANGAIPWIIFVRDRKVFEKKFPNLKILQVTSHTPLKYLISGGLSKPQLIPNFLFPLVQWLEDLLSPFNNLIGMFVTIELVKRKKLLSSVNN